MEKTHSTVQETNSEMDIESGGTLRISHTSAGSDLLQLCLAKDVGPTEGSRGKAAMMLCAVELSKKEVRELFEALQEFETLMVEKNGKNGSV